MFGRYVSSLIDIAFSMMGRFVWPDIRPFCYTRWDMIVLDVTLGGRGKGGRAEGGEGGRRKREKGGPTFAHQGIGFSYAPL